MSLSHSPSVVTNSLLLNLDFANPKRLSTSFGTNLVQDPTYNASTWGTFPSIKTTGIDDPDGTNTAVRIRSIVISGPYTIANNVATITVPNHGLTGSWNNYFIFSSGTGVNGFYTITVVDANTVTIPITASNGTGTVTMYTRTGLRVGFNSFTPNGTDTYTVSFWVRMIGNNSYVSGSSASCDLTDGSPSTNYASQLIQNQWVPIIISGVPSSSSKTFFDLLSDTFGTITMDFWGLKIENQTADNSVLPLTDTIGGITFNLYRPQYATFTTSDITFTRTAAAPKWGGGVYSTLSGNLTAANFLYNNHTMEIWFKINDINPGNYDGTEGYSTLALYRGYHAGLMYTASTMYYFIWNGVSSSSTCASWTLGISGTQIVQGSWYQLAVVNSGGTFIPYLNGTNVGSGFTPTINSSGIGTTNVFSIGSSQVLSPGSGSFAYYSKNTVANIKMYNRALTAQEVLQNFNALRGRFGI